VGGPAAEVFRRCGSAFRAEGGECWRSLGLLACWRGTWLGTSQPQLLKGLKALEELEEGWAALGSE